LLPSWNSSSKRRASSVLHSAEVVAPDGASEGRFVAVGVTIGGKATLDGDALGLVEGVLLGTIIDGLLEGTVDTEGVAAGVD